MIKEDSRFEVMVTSPPDRENLVIEIWYGNEQWAELANENGKITLETYSQKSGKPWRFTYNEMINALEKAYKRLVDLAAPED